MRRDEERIIVVNGETRHYKAYRTDNPLSFECPKCKKGLQGVTVLKDIGFDPSDNCVDCIEESHLLCDCGHREIRIEWRLIP